MQLKTILNFVEPYKSFVYKKVRWAAPQTKTEIEILIEPRANGRAICSRCDKPAPGYDRFHIMQKMSKAIDKVRAGEARQMKADGYEEILKHSRWCFLKRPENLTDKQT